MKKLPKEFKYKGFDYKQIERKGMAAIYTQYLDGDFLAYEVVKIRKQKESEFNGIKYEAKEAYPSDKQWGTYGFTYKEANDAWEKFNELQKERK